MVRLLACQRDTQRVLARIIGTLLIGVSIWACAAPICWAQFPIEGELSSTVFVEEAKNASRVFQRADALLEAEKWDEAVEMLRGQIDREADKVIRMDRDEASTREFVRWGTVSRRCQLELTTLYYRAPEALAVYRERVDPLAKQWWLEGVADRNAEILERIVSRMFASSYGDDALLTLGEIYLEQGRFGEARDAWERMSPTTRRPAPWSAAGMSIYQAVSIKSKQVDAGAEQTPQWLVYPDTKHALADIHARLVLVSILEGSRRRAKTELKWFEELHRDAVGSLGGKTGPWVELLKELLAETSKSQSNHKPRGWNTFASNEQRDQHSPIALEPLAVKWRLNLRRETALGDILDALGRRVGEDREGLLSYHPIVAETENDGPIVFVADRTRIYARSLADGAARFAPHLTASSSAPFFDLTRLTDGEDAFTDDDVFPKKRPYVGVPRFTLTVRGDLLTARMGSPVTGNRNETLTPMQRSRVVVFNIADQGKLLRSWLPENDRWAFDGTPVTDGQRIFVAMRETEPADARVNLHIACFDIASGRRVWRQFICGARSLSGGVADELTHTLLTRSGDRLFVNTNLGAVASVAITTGKIRWITEYARAPFPPSDPDATGIHFTRDLNPCLVAGGLLIAAPADSEQIFACEAASGRLIWETPKRRFADVMHLLGVRGDTLFASGDYLYWIDLQSGRLQCQFPAKRHDGPHFARPAPAGYGRGALAGDFVYWPTREAIYVFEQQPGKGSTGGQPIGVEVIDLKNRRLASGGNLIFADGRILVANPDGIVAFEAVSSQTAISAKQ